MRHYSTRNNGETQKPVQLPTSLNEMTLKSCTGVTPETLETMRILVVLTLIPYLIPYRTCTVIHEYRRFLL